MKNPILLLIIISVPFFGCNKEIKKLTPEEQNAEVIREYPIINLPLEGEIAGRKSELSGLAWHGDRLVLLPQYPQKFDSSSDGALFYIDKMKLNQFISGRGEEKLTPGKISLKAPDLEKYTGIGSGFEAVAFHENKVVFALEMLKADKTSGLLVAGIVDKDTITIDFNKSVEIESQTEIHNFSDEAIFVFQDKIFTIYEANGENINPDPIVNVFDFNLDMLGAFEFDNIEYRITDAAAAGDNGKVWAINYFYPGDAKNIDPARDKLVIDYGIGESHKQTAVVERIVELSVNDFSVNLSGRPPVYIKLEPGKPGRNWEGIALLDKKGFILATDYYPSTILAFIPYSLE